MSIDYYYCTGLSFSLENGGKFGRVFVVLHAAIYKRELLRLGGE